jgi:hypothetical protein
MKKYVFLLGAVWLGALALEAQEAPTAGRLGATRSGPLENTPLLQARVPDGLWTPQGVGQGFPAHLRECSLSVGAGAVTQDIGGKVPHDLLLTRLDYGVMLGPPVGRDHWYGGNWEFVQELFGGWQYLPTGRYLTGATSLLRYDFSTGTRWVPFLDAGIGGSATDIGHPDLGTTGEFNGQIGPGIHYVWSRRTVLTLQYRYMHTSDGGLGSPNQGINENIVYVGMSWFF